MLASTEGAVNVHVHVHSAQRADFMTSTKGAINASQLYWRLRRHASVCVASSECLSLLALLVLSASDTEAMRGGPRT